MTALQHHQNFLLDNIEVIAWIQPVEVITFPSDRSRQVFTCFKFNHFESTHRCWRYMSCLEERRKEETIKSRWMNNWFAHFINISIGSWANALNKFIFIMWACIGDKIQRWITMIASTGGSGTQFTHYCRHDCWGIVLLFSLRLSNRNMIKSNKEILPNLSC